LEADGRVMEMLSEHQCQGWLESYLLTGRHGFFSCYEAFIHIARLLTAYQEDLLSLDELRHRMPELRRREYAIRAELQSIADQTTDRTAYLRLAETLTAFLARLRSSAETLDIVERQRVVRLLVKEILVSDDRIVIRHSIPLPTGPSGSHDPSLISGYSSSASGKSYLLRSGSGEPAARQHLHEPIPEALASNRTGRSIPCPCRLLCRRLCATNALTKGGAMLCRR
jgi:site-specific DNA recombinase